jgi:hypothetical protein
MEGTGLYITNWQYHKYAMNLVGCYSANFSNTFIKTQLAV